MPNMEKQDSILGFRFNLETGAIEPTVFIVTASSNAIGKTLSITDEAVGYQFTIPFEKVERWLK